MSKLHGLADKLFTEVDHLDRAMDRDELDEQALALALASAKRVRRDASLLVQALARQRDADSPGAQRG